LSIFFRGIGVNYNFIICLLFGIIIVLPQKRNYDCCSNVPSIATNNVLTRVLLVHIKKNVQLI